MTRPWRLARAARAQRDGQDERGTGLVEFAMILPVFMILLLGMLEFGFVFDQALTIQYATREGARVGAAMANGGGALGCGSGKSPNAADVDPTIVAAVNRVLRSQGSRVKISSVPTIRIYKATAAGTEVTGAVDIWNYAPGAGPTVDGVVLDYRLASTGWDACSRTNGNPANSVGVSLTYTYQMVTPLGSLLRFFGGSGASTLPLSDRTVMSLNPTQ